MEHEHRLWITPVEHPDPRVQRIGFELNDPYVEQCVSALIGPSSTLLLRRVPTLWVAQVPAVVDASELSRSLGLGPSTAPNSRFGRTLQRLVDFGMARRSPDGSGLDVFQRAAPLSPRQLARLPEWTRDSHDRLLGTHLEQLTEPATSSRPVRPEVVAITARLDRVQASTPGSVALGTTREALGR